MLRTLTGVEYDHAVLLLQLAIPYNTEYDQSRYMNQFLIGEVQYNVIYGEYSEPTIEEILKD